MYVCIYVYIYIYYMYYIYKYWYIVGRITQKVLKNNYQNFLKILSKNMIFKKISSNSRKKIDSNNTIKSLKLFLKINFCK